MTVEMRVVAGEAKGRRLKSPKSEGTRPIIGRVKTALFDMLGTQVVDARVLDLFGGTGSVGIEALSRGARSVTFVELDNGVLRILRDNLRLTGLADRAETIRGDAFRFLADAAGQGREFAIVYVAPPQYRGMAVRALTMLDASPIVAPGGRVIVQIHPRERTEFAGLALGTLKPYDERRYGSTALLFYERVAGNSALPQGAGKENDATTEPI
jgi:16S rRNA (guanine966-N2)-methyltransferase